MIAFAAPFQELASRAAERGRGDLAGLFFSGLRRRAKTSALKQQLDQAVQDSIQQRELELENTRLRELLAFKRSLPGPAIAAEIIGKDPSAWFKTVIIDKGPADGVQRGLPAVTVRGAWSGRSWRSPAHQSKLMLIIDRNSAADALVQRTRARGIVKGASRDECYLDYVLHEDDVRVGDLVVSSGFDGVYPKGLLIGTVTAVNFQGSDFFKEVRITPAVDFDKLEEVLIILKAAAACAAALRRTADELFHLHRQRPVPGDLPDGAHSAAAGSWGTSSICCCRGWSTWPRFGRCTRALPFVRVHGRPDGQPLGGPFGLLPDLLRVAVHRRATGGHRRSGPKTRCCWCCIIIAAVACAERACSSPCSALAGDGLERRSPASDPGDHASRSAGCCWSGRLSPWACAARTGGSRAGARAKAVEPQPGPRPEPRERSR
ncbi:MAG: rod shape-determining protein MreC [Desulfobacterales bacterium]|nr:rod shape-determining protein MreC [Desulfobacterales bacterium]